MPQAVQVSQAAPVPPQNLDAEESVLGAMLLSPGAIGAVSEVLDAGDFYRESRLIAERIGLPRFKFEALLGLALVAALNQKLAEAEACAAEALAILAAAGDRYLTALVQLGLGAAQVLCDHRSAGARLTEAARLAAQCGDRLPLLVRNAQFVVRDPVVHDYQAMAK